MTRKSTDADPAVLALIPARGGSKGIPGKNLALLDGRPLIAWAAEVALQAGVFEEVLVSTDSPEIARVAEAWGARAPFLRPQELAGDRTPTFPVVTHALEYVKIFAGEEVMEITSGDPIEIKTNRRRFTAKALLLATGATHRHLDAPGESRLSGHGVSYCSTCDGPLFKGKYT